MYKTHFFKLRKKWNKLSEKKRKKYTISSSTGFDVFYTTGFLFSKINIHQKVEQDLTNGGPGKQVARLELIIRYSGFFVGSVQERFNGSDRWSFLGSTGYQKPPQLRNQLHQRQPAFTGDHSSSFSSPSTKS